MAKYIKNEKFKGLSLQMSCKCIDNIISGGSLVKTYRDDDDEYTEETYINDSYSSEMKVSIENYDDGDKVTRLIIGSFIVLTIVEYAD